MSLCSIGECNKLRYSRTVGVKYLESFERDELGLIFQRSGLTILNMNGTICHHHEQTVLRRFSSMQKNCFDRFKDHKKLLKVCSINTVYLDFNHLKMYNGIKC